MADLESFFQFRPKRLEDQTDLQRLWDISHPRLDVHFSTGHQIGNRVPRNLTLAPRPRHRHAIRLLTLNQLSDLNISSLSVLRHERSSFSNNFRSASSTLCQSKLRDRKKAARSFTSSASKRCLNKANSDLTNRDLKSGLSNQPDRFANWY